MRLLRVVFGIAAVLILVLIVTVRLLPDSYSVHRSILISAKPEAIFPLLDSPQGWLRWSVWAKRDPAMKLTYSGPVQGNGASWRWQSRSEGNGSMTLMRVSPPQKVEYELLFGNGQNPMYGSVTLIPQNDQTQVIWEAHGNAGTNWAMKLFIPFMDTMIGKDFNEGLQLLKKSAQSS